MAFVFKYGWDSQHNNNLSHLTAHRTKNKSEQFSAAQITHALKTAQSASIPLHNEEALALQKALSEQSAAITVVKGAHQENNPHIAVSFVNKSWHVNILMLEPGKWVAKDIPKRRLMIVEQALDYSPTLSLVKKAKEQCQEKLLCHPDIQGIGIGYKRVSGAISNELSIIVHVEKKYPESTLATDRLIEKEFPFFDPESQCMYYVNIDVQEG